MREFGSDLIVSLENYFIPYTFFFRLSIVSFNLSRSEKGGLTSWSFFSSLAGGLRFRLSHTLSYTSDIVFTCLIQLSASSLVSFLIKRGDIIHHNPVNTVNPREPRSFLKSRYSLSLLRPHPRQTVRLLPAAYLWL